MDKKDIGKLVKLSQKVCPCCESDTEVILDLKNYPITELFRPINDEEEPYGFIDQTGRFCTNCSHFFLEKILNPEVIYSDSNYRTSVVPSKGDMDCSDEFYDFILKKSFQSDFSSSQIIDIGGSDSYLLKKFLNRTDKLLNIDPHASSDDPRIKIQKIFVESLDFSQLDLSLPTIFVSSHTFEHLEDPGKVLRKLANVVREKDELFLQFPSVEKLVEFSRYDQICDQHINLFSINSITTMLEREGLFLNTYEFDTFHFGTIRLKFSRSSEIKLKGAKLSISDIKKSYENFKFFYHTLNSLIEDKFTGGQGFGAGLLVPTLAYYLPVVHKLDKIIDESPSRIGKKYINLSPPIVDRGSLDFGEPILITSISSKATARVIFQKLGGLGFKDICLPTISC